MSSERKKPIKSSYKMPEVDPETLMGQIIRMVPSLYKQRHLPLNTYLTKKEVPFDQWYLELHVLVLRRTVTTLEAWLERKVTKYALMSDYKKGKTIYQAILTYVPHKKTLPFNESKKHPIRKDV